MQAFIARRLLQSVVVLLGIITLVFFLMRLAGDPAVIMMPAEASAEQIDAYRKAMGLDRPLAEQYWTYLTNVVRGDFGMSLRFRQPAMELVLERVPATIQLAVSALAVGMLVGIPMGFFSALRRETVVDSLFKALALLGQSMPGFWLGIMLILVLSLHLGLFPTGGRGDPSYLVLPAITLGANAMASIARLTRSAMLEIIHKDYIRTARSKGLPERLILFRHAFKNAAIPVVTIMGIQLGGLLGGAVVTETVFSWPGIGRLAINSIYNRDYAVVQAAVFMTAVFFVFINFVVDLVYGFLDPRIRYS